MKEKLKQKKGFTIVELLAVIVIIAVLATLVITSVIGYRENAKEEYMNTLKNQLALAAKSYYSDNPKELPRGQIEGDYKLYNTSVMASELAVNNYFTNELVDDNGNSCEAESYVVVSNMNGVYNYQPCLKCKDGEILLSQSGVCEIPENTVPYCSVKVENENQNVKKLTVYTNTTSGVVKSTIKAAEDGNYYAYKPGTYEFTVKGPNGDEATCGVTVYMKEDESIPTCKTTFKENKNGKHIVVFEWEDNISLKSVTNPVDGTMYKDDYICSYEKYTHTGAAEFSFTMGTQEKTYTMKVTDCNGNTNTCSYTVPKVNELKCETQLVSSTNSTYKVKFSWFDESSLKSVTNPTNGTTYKSYSCSDSVNISDSNTFSFSRTTTNKTYTMTVTDCDGNTATCDYTVPKKSTPSGGGTGGSDICIGSGCNDDEEEETGCTTKCYAGESSDYNYSTCRYYQCSADGCDGYWLTIPGCVEEEEETNPNTGCFLEGTKVLTKNGYKNIEDIKVGDYVLSYNEETKENEYNRVYDTFIHRNNNEDLYELTIKGKVLKVTEAHRFYVKEKGTDFYAWKAVRNLNIGDVIIDNNKTEHEITNINFYSHFGTVYNITVENNYNYYVSDNNYLVHVHNGRCFTKIDNKCPTGSYEYSTYCCK